MTTTVPHVVIIDDTSSMWGNLIRVFGPYPTRNDALLDQERLCLLYPKHAFIQVSALNNPRVPDTCPFCNQAPGVPCRTADGRLAQRPHAHRGYVGVAP